MITLMFIVITPITYSFDVFNLTTPERGRDVQTNFTIELSINWQWSRREAQTNMEQLVALRSRSIALSTNPNPALDSCMHENIFKQEIVDKFIENRKKFMKYLLTKEENFHLVGDCRKKYKFK